MWVALFVACFCRARDFSGRLKYEKMLHNNVWGPLWFQSIQQIIFVMFQIEVLNKHLFITSKPMIYLVNLSEKDFLRKKNKWWASKFKLQIFLTSQIV